MFERFTDRARRVVVLAQEEARLLNHNYIGTEHVLLGLVHEGEGLAAQALESLGVSLEAVRAQVEEIIGHGGQAISGHIPFTPRAKKVLELSLREALQLGHNYIGTEHILLGLIREGEGVAAQVLVRLGADLPVVRSRVILLTSDPSAAATLTQVHTAADVAGALHCSFCGRDVWEVEHYLPAGAAVICEHCIEAASAALEAAADDQHVLALPPRVFGTPPDDDPAAADEIAEALFTVFGSESAEHVAERLEGGAQLVEFMVAARDRHSDVRVVGVVVSRVRFASRADASVAFEIVVESGERFGFVGAVMRREGKWIVARTTVAEVLRTGGVILPPNL